MKIRGERECRGCGRRWSYYETGAVACPDCGSVRSVGIDERRRHTDGTPELDLGAYRDAAVEGRFGAVADDLLPELRSYCNARGFLDAGELRPPDDRYLSVAELRAAVDAVRRDHADRVRGGGERTAPEASYLLAVFRAAADSGDRPAPDAVPRRFRAPRGLAYARALSTYRAEAATHLDDNPNEPARRALGRLRDRLKRVEALEGDVDPETVETLVTVARELAAAVDGSRAALASARDRLERLE